jgi:NAD-dependent dihydropyrimidine dehydrogenase PreA subunit
MSSEPTLRSSLTEHLRLARKLRTMHIYFHPEKCTGVWQCYAVCPVDCWTPDRERRVAIFHNPERCIACRACVLQCPRNAIELK